MEDTINTKLCWFFEAWEKQWPALSRNSMANNRERYHKSLRSSCDRVDILHKTIKLTS